MSEQEWRDAIEAGLLLGDCGDENDQARYLDGVLAAIAPLRAKDRREALREAAERLEHACDTEIALLTSSKAWRWRWRRMREVLAVQADPMRTTQSYFRRAATLLRNLPVGP